MAVGQNQFTSFLFFFCGDWDVHWGYGVLTHSHIMNSRVVPAESWSHGPRGELVRQPGRGAA